LTKEYCNLIKNNYLLDGRKLGIWCFNKFFCEDFYFAIMKEITIIGTGIEISM